MLMHIWNRCRGRTFDHEKRSITAVSEPCHLRKQPAIDEGSGEVGGRLTLDHALIRSRARQAWQTYYDRRAPVLRESDTISARRW
jgi:hypothetical protein